MEFFIVWFICSVIVAFVFGAARRIGFVLSLVACLFLSPLLGLIITLCSETDDKFNDRQKSLNLQQQHSAYLAQLNSKKISVSDEIEKLSKLKNDGAITQEDYDRLIKKLST